MTTRRSQTILTALLLVSIVALTAAPIWALRFDTATGVESSDSLGVISLVVVPVVFKDRANSTSLAALDEKITELSAYFNQVSYGKVTVTATILPKWYRLPRSETWYGRGYEQWEMLILDALGVAGRDVDFQEYDHVAIVHAGDDESRSFNSSDITSFGTPGKAIVNTYRRRLVLGVSCLAETDPVGPYAHFLALNMGLPDVTKGWTQIGEWDLMAHGFWAGNGTMPVHPTSWVKLKAKWITDSNIATVEGRESAEVEVTALGREVGIKAVKIPVTDKSYFMVEARQREGYDKYLPSDGVLILYVDESFLKQGTAMHVVDVNPQTPTLDDATLQEGEVYSNSTLGFSVQVLSTNGSAYRIRLDRSQAPVSAKITVQALPNATVKINDRTYTASPEGRIERNVMFGPQIIEVPHETDYENGSKIVFKGWSDGASEPQRALNLSSDMVIKAQYLKQHRLDVSSPYGTPIGDGWYDEGATATVSVQETVEHSNGTRRVFKSWSIDSSLSSPTIELVMDRPKMLVGVWETEYRVDFTAEGLPESTPVTLTVNGEVHHLSTPFTYSAWYSPGEEITFQIETEAHDSVQGSRFTAYVDNQGNLVAQPLIVDKPMTVTALYTGEQGGSLHEDGLTKVSSSKTLFPVSLEDVTFYLSRYPLLLKAFIVVGSPAYWSYLIATASGAGVPQLALSRAVMLTVFGSLIGLIYIFPLSLLVMAVSWWRLHRRPRFKVVTVPALVTGLGAIVTLIGAMSAIEYAPLLVFIGVIATVLGVGFLMGIVTSTLIMAIALGPHATRIRWK